MKKIFRLLMVAFLFVSMVACSKKPQEDEVVDPLADYDKFTYETLEFYVPKSIGAHETTLENYKFAVDSNQIAVFVNQFTHEDLEKANYTVEDVKALVFEGMEQKDLNGVAYTTYTNAGTDGVDYFYVYGFLEGSDRVWDFNVACRAADRETNEPIMMDILAKAVAH